MHSFIRLSLITLATAACSVTGRADECAPGIALLTLDRSSSMTERIDGGPTKWEVATQAVSRVTESLQARVAFGLQIFPTPDACGPGAVVIEPALHASAAITSALAEPPAPSGHYTPLAETLDAAAAALSTVSTESAVHLVLVTDGWQWCAPYDRSTRFNPVRAVEQLAAQGVIVHIVGFGAGVDALTLNRAAVAAGTALPGCDPEGTSPMGEHLCYLQASDDVTLEAALDSVAATVAAEACNGMDDDCDGSVDEDFDRDLDAATTCDVILDCDDGDATVHPYAQDVCDETDNDCDGRVDESCQCQDGESRPCGPDAGACSSGAQLCEDGLWSACRDAIGPMNETCNELDDDCDGTTDGGLGCAIPTRPVSAGPSCACSAGRAERMNMGEILGFGFLIGSTIARARRRRPSEG